MRGVPSGQSCSLEEDGCETEQQSWEKEKRADSKYRKIL